jgi:hypothetical protein
MNGSESTEAQRERERGSTEREGLYEIDPCESWRREGAMGERLTQAELFHFLDTQVPFVKSLGISCEEFRPGYAVARWKRDEQWLRPGGYLFGGGLMSLADAAIYMAILGQIGSEAMAVTIERLLPLFAHSSSPDFPAPPSCPSPTLPGSDSCK